MTDLSKYSVHKKLFVENTVLLVSLLYDMGKVKLVINSNDPEEPNTVNSEEVKQAIRKAELVLANIY
jgi:hypothetical protein